jgi:Tfp pilus assembly protein PilF
VEEVAMTNAPARGPRWRAVVSGLGLALVLAGCAAPRPPALEAGLFADERFAPPASRIDADAVFELSDSMQRYLAGEIAAQARHKGRQRALVDALVNPAQLRLDYDAEHTRTAAEAFDARAGNCLSLVLMTAAFAKAMDLQVHYQSAMVDDTWNRSGNLVLASGHVNVTIGRRLIDDRRRGDPADLTIDFLPPEDLRGLRTQIVGEQTVLAMYMNNRAAESLLGGAIDEAYWWARGAVTRDPAFTAALNTLGVVYLHHGDLERADRVFARVLAMQPGHLPAMANRAVALQRLGRDAEAGTLRQQLAQLEPHPPYHFFDRGRAALQRGELRQAREMFQREVDRAPYQPEFHLWLGVTHLRLGDPERARRHLDLAQQHSSSPGERERLAGKLAWLARQGSAAGAPGSP